MRLRPSALHRPGARVPGPAPPVCAWCSWPTRLPL